MKAQEILNNVDRLIAEGEKFNKWLGRPVKFDIRSNCEQLGIFDWWNDTLSASQLKQMKKFLKTAIKLGYTGYVCFKVGASGCSHGMWAHELDSDTGYSPNEGGCLYHSFRNGDNYYDLKINGQWLGNDEKYQYSLKEIKAILNV